MSMDQIQEAIRWADQPEHNGAGYVLALHFGGYPLFASVTQAESGGYELYEVIQGKLTEYRIFPNLDRLGYVRVIWR